MRRYTFDVVVIGGGTGGMVSAALCGILGADALLVERARLGGECTWTGCIPSKALLHFARVLREGRALLRDDFATGSLSANPPAIMRELRSLRERIYLQEDAPPNFERFGVTVRRATARFVDDHTLELTSGDEDNEVSTVTFRSAIIATGSEPKFVGTLSPRCVTNDTFFELEELPATIVIAGSGPVGIEMAQALNALGTSVTVVSPSSKILDRDDPELAGALLNELRAEGIRFVFSRRVIDVRNERPAIAVLDDGTEMETDAVLCAMGRRGRTASLNLQALGVRVEDELIRIDATCRTDLRHIFAVGDVATRLRFTHMAEHMARVAAVNALYRLRTKVDNRHQTWCTFTTPELAHLGASEQSLLQSGKRFQTYRLPFFRIDRANTDGATSGTLKVMATASGRILGASALGGNAGEIISELALAMKNDVTLGEISNTVHPYPTYAYGMRRLCDEAFLKSKHVASAVGVAARLLRLGRDRKNRNG